jgi:hypothetical protein
VSPAAVPQPLAIIMDADWAHDDVIRHAVALLAEKDVPVTLFVTHRSPVFDELRAQPLVELGVHPNFNDLLSGTAPAGESAELRCRRIMELVPGATAIRSHSMCQSSVLLNLAADLGFRHEVNTLVMAHAGIALKPWRHWYGPMIRVPTVFEDSIAGHRDDGWQVDTLLAHPGLRVCAFHPIRLFLNADKPALPGPRELATRPPRELREHVRDPRAPGSRSFLERLVAGHRAAGGSFALVRDIAL